MFKSKKILAVIAARGGSKGLPRKNVLPLLDVPLLAWTVLAAKQSEYIDRLIISSEDQEILDVAAKYGADVPFVRPAELAQDDTPGTAAVLHAVRTLPGYDYVVLLQPTSPLRTTADIDACIELIASTNAPSVVSVTETDKSVFWTCTKDEQNKAQFVFDETYTRLRRQQLPKTYMFNGAVYVAACDWFLRDEKLISSETVLYEMPRERSVDIDTPVDFAVCEALLKSQRSDSAALPIAAMTR